MPTTARILRNYQVTLPKKIREKLKLGEGDLIRLEEGPQGILLTPVDTIDRSQAWFWQKEWQEEEKEVDEEIKKGKVKRFKSITDLIRNLKK